MKFLDFTVKESVLCQAWSQKQAHFQNKPIYFDHECSPELQKTRARVCYMIKQLKVKGIRAKCPYPAQLQLSLETREKTYEMLTDTVSMLKDLGVTVQMEEREQPEREQVVDRGMQAGGTQTGD